MNGTSNASESKPLNAARIEINANNNIENSSNPKTSQNGVLNNNHECENENENDAQNESIQCAQQNELQHVFTLEFESTPQQTANGGAAGCLLLMDKIYSKNVSPPPVTRIPTSRIAGELEQNMMDSEYIAEPSSTEQKKSKQKLLEEKLTNEALFAAEMVSLIEPEHELLTPTQQSCRTISNRSSNSGGGGGGGLLRGMFARLRSGGHKTSYQQQQQQKQQAEDERQQQQQELFRRRAVTISVGEHVPAAFYQQQQQTEQNARQKQSITTAEINASRRRRTGKWNELLAIACGEMVCLVFFRLIIKFAVIINRSFKSFIK